MKNHSDLKSNKGLKYLRIVLFNGLILLIALVSFAEKTSAQSYTTWYNKAQERIDTLRKGDFGIQIVDKI